MIAVDQSSVTGLDFSPPFRASAWPHETNGSIDGLFSKFTGAANIKSASNRVIGRSCQIGATLSFSIPEE